MAQTKTENRTSSGLKAAFQDTLSALGDRAVQGAQKQVSGLTDKMNDFSEGGAAKKVVANAAEASAQGDSPVAGAVKGAVSAGKDKIAEALPGTGGKRKPPAATKAMNFVDSIDVGVPVSVAFNQWTQYDEWPSFMKKVEEADYSEESGSLRSKLHVFWFRRTQESSIQDQIPDERIVWRSEGQKGHVDGCVTFHEIGPRLTRILVTMEYYPQGFVERVGNLWRAQGRRLRLELKHFRRHVMMHTILEPDEAEGWRGEIEDGEVTRTHEDVLKEEEERGDQQEDRAEQDQGDEDRADGSAESNGGADDEDRTGEPEDESDESEEPDQEDEDASDREADEGEPDSDSDADQEAEGERDGRGSSPRKKPAASRRRRAQSPGG
ncbi:MAG TPA: SRPBCC family protein [Microlunatus sp.]